MIEKPTPMPCAASLAWLIQRISVRTAAARSRSGAGSDERVRQPVG